MEVCPIFPFCNGEDGRASVAAAPCRRSLLGKMNEEQASIAAAPCWGQRSGRWRTHPPHGRTWPEARRQPPRASSLRC